MSLRELLATHADADVCHLATIGRRTGRWRLIEIWFATDGERAYLLAGGRDRAQWVRNLRADPHVRLRLGGRGGHTVDATARVIDDPEEDRHARGFVAAKYQGWRPGAELSPWAATSLPVAIEEGQPAEEAGGMGPIRPGGQ